MVGKKEANAWGLSDMLGNVLGWTWDRAESNSSVPLTDLIGVSRGSPRGRRGCSYAPDPVKGRTCRVATRNK